MAESVNGIVIQITDGVDASIPAKITAIGTAARESDVALKSLQTSLNSINASGLAGLKADIASTSSATQQLAATTKQASVSNQDFATSSRQVVNANQATAQSVLQATTTTLQLRTARAALTTVTKNLAQAQQKLGNSPKALATIQGYQQQQQAAAQLVAQLTNAKNAQQQVANTSQSVGKAAHGSVSGIQAMSGAIRVSEGNFGTNVRAAERFLVTTLKLGPAAQAIFPLIGAAAFAGILFIIAEHVDKLVNKFKALTMEAQKARLEMLRLNQEKLKGEDSFKDSAFNLFAGRENAPDIITGDPSHNIQKINNELRLVEIANQLNEHGKKGLALQKAKEESVKNEIAAAERALQQAKTLQTASKIPISGVQDTGFGSILGRSDFLRSDVAKLALGPVLPFLSKIGKGGIQPAIPTESEQQKQFEQQAKQYGNTVEELEIKLAELKEKAQGLKLDEPFAALKDETKAARLQLQKFKEDFAQLKINKGGVIRPQDELDFINAFQKKNKILPENVAEIDTRKGTATQAVERQNATLEQLAERYQSAADAVGLYSDAKRVEHALTKIDIELKRSLIDTESAEAKQIKENAKFIIEHTGYQRELEKTYKEFKGPLDDYKDGQLAISDLEKAGVISKEQAVQATNKLNRAYQDFRNPANEFEISLEHQANLLGKYGTALKVASEIEGLRASLQKDGKDLDQAQIAQLTARLTSMEQERQVQTELNSLWEKTVGTKDKILAQQKALDKGLQDEIITLTNYKLATLGANLALNKLANSQDAGTFKSNVVEVLGGLVDTSRNTVQKMDGIWTDFFRTLDDGFADSIGRALVYNDDLKQGLLDTARQAVAGLISSLIKLGIELVLIEGLEKVFPKLKAVLESGKPQDTAAQTAKNTAAAVASIAAISAAEYLAIDLLQEPAWELAEAISLISFGANAVGAVAGIEAVTQAGSAAMKGALHLSRGIARVPGYGFGDTVPAFLTPGESVLTREATASLGEDRINALNSGARNIQGASSVGSGNTRPVINIVHDGSTKVVVEKTSEQEIRFIAKQEANNAVATRSDSTIAGSIANPNSRTSSALKTHTTAKRER